MFGTLVADVGRAPEWRGGLKALRALERDGEGRAALCESHSDAEVRTIASTARLTYEAPVRLSWTQEKGELRSVEGSWSLEELGGHRTRATYALTVDLGRVLSLMIKGAARRGTR